MVDYLTEWTKSRPIGEASTAQLIVFLENNILRGRLTRLDTPLEHVIFYPTKYFVSGIDWVDSFPVLMGRPGRLGSPDFGSITQSTQLD